MYWTAVFFCVSGVQWPLKRQCIYFVTRCITKTRRQNKQFPRNNIKNATKLNKTVSCLNARKTSSHCLRQCVVGNVNIKQGTWNLTLNCDNDCAMRCFTLKSNTDIWQLGTMISARSLHNRLIIHNKFINSFI